MPLPLTAELTLGDGRTFNALPVGAAPTGIWVAVPRAMAPRLPIVPDISVQLTLQGHRPWQSPCCVTETFEARDALELRLVWANASRVRLAMPGAIQEALQVAARQYGAQPRVRWDGAVVDVVDLTEEGCTVAVPNGGTSTSGDMLEGELVLPDRRAAQPFRARVGRVRPIGPDTLATLRFVGDSRVRGRVADRISAWLLTQRRRELRQTG